MLIQWVLKISTTVYCLNQLRHNNRKLPLYSLGDKCLKIPQFEGAVVCGPEGPHPHHIDTYLLGCVQKNYSRVPYIWKGALPSLLY